MLEEAVAAEPGFALSRIELDGPEVSYTIDTLDALAAKYPTTCFRFLMGGDSVPDLPHWKEAERLVLRYEPIVVARPDTGDVIARCTLGPKAVAQLAEGMVSLTLRPVSSTDIRGRLAEGKSLNGLVPDGVADYIRRHRLYKHSGVETDS